LGVEELNGSADRQGPGHFGQEQIEPASLLIFQIRVYSRSFVATWFLVVALSFWEKTQ
jgi:hypothetical protein